MAPQNGLQPLGFVNVNSLLPILPCMQSPTTPPPPPPPRFPLPPSLSNGIAPGQINAILFNYFVTGLLYWLAYVFTEASFGCLVHEMSTETCYISIEKLELQIHLLLFSRFPFFFLSPLPGRFCFIKAGRMKKHQDNSFQPNFVGDIQYSNECCNKEIDWTCNWENNDVVSADSDILELIG